MLRLDDFKISCKRFKSNIYHTKFNIIKGEFLLNCQGNLGMFATFNGSCLRPPVAWCANCTQFQISNPYVLCIANDTIKVYNIFDSKLKQEIKRYL